MTRIAALSLIAALAAGCASAESRLDQFTRIPSTCEAIYAEMVAAAERESRSAAIRSLLSAAPAGIGIAAAAGAVPVGLSWLPLVGSLAPLIPVGSENTRIWHLAQAHLYYGCEPPEVDSVLEHSAYP